VVGTIFGRRLPQSKCLEFCIRTPETGPSQIHLTRPYREPKDRSAFGRSTGACGRSAWARTGRPGSSGWLHPTRFLGYVMGGWRSAARYRVVARGAQPLTRPMLYDGRDFGEQLPRTRLEHAEFAGLPCRHHGRNRGLGHGSGEGFGRGPVRIAMCLPSKPRSGRSLPQGRSLGHHRHRSIERKLGRQLLCQSAAFACGGDIAGGFAWAPIADSPAKVVQQQLSMNFVSCAMSCREAVANFRKAAQRRAHRQHLGANPHSIRARAPA